jgi:hypothetical protein
MNGKSRSCEIASYALFQVFENDSTIDARELETIKKLALEDAVVDENEKRILRKIFGRVTQSMVEPEVWLQISGFRKRHGI